MFNALKYTKKLVEVGFTKQQAETALELGIEVMNENLASKEDLKETTLLLRGEMQELSSELRGEMQELCSELRGEMQELSSELRGEMANLRQEISDLKLELKQDMSLLQDRLTIRMGAGFAATIAILGSLKFI